MDTFPIEVLANIFAFLDDQSILNSEKVCPKWRSAIKEEYFYAKKCLDLLKRHNTLKSTFAKNRFASVIKHDTSAAKKFYFKLKGLPSQWDLKKNGSLPTPRIFRHFCKTGEVSEDWVRKHNYTGVYDMVWIPDKSYLIVSCYDTIQVWDMVANTRVNTFLGSQLDTQDEKATCFYGCGPALVTGTSFGRLQAFDLISREKIGESTIDHNHKEMFSDIKGFGNSVLCVDWKGLLFHWTWKYDKKRDQMNFELKKSFYPPFPADDGKTSKAYTSRFCERLVDFNEHIAITNCHDMFCIFDINKGTIGTWVRTSRSVLCQQVFETSAYWAGQGGILYHLKQCLEKKSISGDEDVKVIDSEEVTECYQTRFEDSITSMSVRDDTIVLGDVNAEIHVLNRKPDVPLSKGSFRFLLENGHSYRSYIWAVEMDATRIFSGDSDACLVVHDFWDQTGTETESNEEPEVPVPKRMKSIEDGPRD